MSDATIEDQAATFDGMTPALQAERPGQPGMLSHVAYITRDTAATTDFYSRLLGMELVNAVLDDAIPSTGEPVPYFHSFFRMADGSTVAFFEAPELPPLEEPPHPAYKTFQHLAMQVDTPETVDRWHRWLESNGVEVLGPVDHKIIYSIYFHDPNGIRLEITTPLSPAWNDNAADAAAQLADWNAVKDGARASGDDMATVLHRLASERSHRRS
ncbi:MAG TPA: VOC family protein [Acidimicrobiales bacterium]|jgi:catechol 2,3-dioxygenase-like lactoylglutathione lyase family enzyme